MDRPDLPTIVHPEAAAAGTTSGLAPGTTGSTRQEREPYAVRQARRDQQRQRENQAQQEGRGGDHYTWSNDMGENPYLSHLRPRAAGYAGSEVSSSSIGGTSMGGGSSLYSSHIGGNQSYTGGYSGSVSNSGGTGFGAGPSGRIIYTPDDRRSGSTTGSQSISPPLLSPIPQRRISPTSFVLGREDHDDHSLRSASRTNSGEAATRKGGSFLSIPPGGSTSHSATSRKRRSTKSASSDVDSPLRRWVRYLNMELGLSNGSMVAVCLGLVAGLKWLIGLGGYSGRADHPRKGDFEAQRFWMDLTVNEKCGVRWYEVGGVGDGDWWRLDYPPLTAYISWIFGKIGQTILPSSFAGRSSRGNESLALTVYMRWTVLALESISWWPIVVLWCWSGWGVGTRSKRTRMVTILSILLQPSLILIDNGHFQYNSFPIAMTLLAVYLFQSDRDLLGAIAFSASLLFKQMGLYWSPAVFGYLLGKCVWIGGKQGLILFVKIGVTTAFTFLLAFLPFLRPFPSALLVLLGRIFPLQRGIFEDKVANFWCASNVVFKWKNWFATGSMAKLATLATLLAITPTLAILLWTSYRLRRPAALQNSPPGLPPTAPLIPLALFTSSMAFFLFSFQVHEKSILVPLLSVYMLLGEKGEGRGTVWNGVVGLLNVATYSMYPLLKRDDQTLQYVVWTLGWNYLVGYNPIKVVNLKLRWIGYLVYTFIAVHHLSEAFVTPPARYPDIYPVTNTLLSFGIFGLTWLIASWKLLEMAVGMVGLGGFGAAAGRPGQDARGNKEKTK